LIKYLQRFTKLQKLFSFKYIVINNFMKSKFLVTAVLVLIIIGITVFTLNKKTEQVLESKSYESSISKSLPNIEQSYLPPFEKLELARTTEDRAMGYMNRTEICTKCGMLFIFDTPQIQSFWMRNTLVELKIIFLDDNGKIVNMGIGKPKQEFPTVRSISPVKYVLEVPANTEFDFADGKVLDIPNIIKLGTEYNKNRI
jgi:uncharacterized membrane protein (UPF0127 family)